MVDDPKYPRRTYSAKIADIEDILGGKLYLPIREFIENLQKWAEGHKDVMIGDEDENEFMFYLITETDRQYQLRVEEAKRRDRQDAEDTIDRERRIYESLRKKFENQGDSNEG